MKRNRNRRRRAARVPATGGALVIDGVTPGSTRRPPGSSRTSAGRLRVAVRSAKKKSIARAASKPAKAKARVKASKIKQAGLKSRLLGHVSASGKRNQGRRNSDNR